MNRAAMSSEAKVSERIKLSSEPATHAAERVKNASCPRCAQCNEPLDPKRTARTSPALCVDCAFEDVPYTD